MHEATGNSPAPLPAVEPLLQQLGQALQQRLIGVNEPVSLVGIRSGGLWLAERLGQQLQRPVWSLSATYHRDDFASSGLHPQLQPSQLPDSLDGHHVWLIDDVLHTGRTLRAAINELFDYGRPRCVNLAVLLDRGGRELPIAPDLCADRISVAPNMNVKLDGPEPLRLALTPRRTP